jgi:capping protein alpha
MSVKPSTSSARADYISQVQLTTSHSASFPCPVEANGSQSVASQIVTTISKIETAYHLELNDVYGELGDKAFRA